VAQTIPSILAPAIDVDPLVSEGKLVGAIGCSGGSGSQDEVVARAGAAAFAK